MLPAMEVGTSGAQQRDFRKRKSTDSASWGSGPLATEHILKIKIFKVEKMTTVQLFVEELNQKVL